VERTGRLGRRGQPGARPPVLQGGHVSNLARSPDGTLLATVQGTQRYSTAVEWVGGEEVLEGRCTCPIGGVCKHSIAVVLSYLDAVEKDRPVPTAGPDDPRWENRWIVTALEGAGREAEVLPFLEAEAPLTTAYPDLVRRLLQVGRTEDARRWAMDGIAATGVEWPGIASELQSILRDMAERAKDWPTVAAHDARPFFEHPSVQAWETMRAAARKAGVEDGVRAAAMYFAETGKPPIGRGGSPPWPLPEIADPPARPGSPERVRSPSGRDRPPGPSYEFLIGLAMQDGRLEDVLRWYGAFAKDRSDRYGAEQYAERVADAVAERFPERALTIYRAGAERHLVHTGDTAYREAARYLRKMKRVLEQLGRAGEWAADETAIREQYRRRRNFIEILDRLERDRIVGGKK
jgi:uncharacterized Zn finger protein